MTNLSDKMVTCGLSGIKLTIYRVFVWRHTSSYPKQPLRDLKWIFVVTFGLFCQIAHRIRTGVQGLGEACISLIQSGGAVQSSPKDPFSKRELAENCRHVAEKVTFYYL